MLVWLFGILGSILVAALAACSIGAILGILACEKAQEEEENDV